MNEQAAVTRAERLAGEIADEILDGTLPPGSRLDEQGLATRHGVSRTPVREALRQLGASGLVDIRPHRGAAVAQVTHAQLEELFVATGELEATCARLAAMSMTPVERRRLRALHDHMGTLVATDDGQGYAEANVAFHGLVYAGTHNGVIRDMATGLRRRLLPYRRAQFRAPGRLPRSHSEHDAVVRAIVGGDAAGAHAAMLEHVSLVEDAFEQVASSRSAPRTGSSPAGALPG